MTVRDSQSCQLRDSRITIQDQFGIYRAYADTVRRYVAARLGAHDRDAGCALIDALLAEECDEA